jgi:hypothetical protein
MRGPALERTFDRAGVEHHAGHRRLRVCGDGFPRRVGGGRCPRRAREHGAKGRDVGDPALPDGVERAFDRGGDGVRQVRRERTRLDVGARQEGGV